MTIPVVSNNIPIPGGNYAITSTECKGSFAMSSCTTQCVSNYNIDTNSKDNTLTSTTKDLTSGCSCNAIQLTSGVGTLDSHPFTVVDIRGSEKIMANSIYGHTIYG
jgi:hypothetical protein